MLDKNTGTYFVDWKVPFVTLVLRRGDDVEETPVPALGVTEGNVVGVVAVVVSEKLTTLARDVGVSEGGELGVLDSSKLTEVLGGSSKGAVTGKD